MKAVFTDKESTCHELLHCISSLSNSDREIYHLLRELGPVTIEQLSERMQKNRSTVYRSLQKLMFSGLCEKMPESLKNGGYVHLYNCSNIALIKSSMKSCVDIWFEDLENRLDSE
jgi:predicted transcriptional regulator